MSKLEDEVQSVEEILENIALVRGEKFEDMCKFLLNTGSLMRAFMMGLDEQHKMLVPFMQQVISTMINQHADAVGVSTEELRDAIKQATRIQSRLDAIGSGAANG